MHNHKLVAELEQSWKKHSVLVYPYSAAEVIVSSSNDSKEFERYASGMFGFLVKLEDSGNPNLNPSYKNRVGRTLEVLGMLGFSDGLSAKLWNLDGYFLLSHFSIVVAEQLLLIKYLQTHRLY